MDIDTIAKGYVEVFGKICPVCKTKHSVVVLEKDLEKYKSGKENVQRCFPYLSSDGREIILSGLTGECYTTYMGKEE